MTLKKKKKNNPHFSLVILIFTQNPSFHKFHVPSKISLQKVMVLIFFNAMLDADTRVIQKKSEILF